MNNGIRFMVSGIEFEVWANPSGNRFATNVRPLLIQGSDMDCFGIPIHDGDDLPSVVQRIESGLKSIEAVEG